MAADDPSGEAGGPSGLARLLRHPELRVPGIGDGYVRTQVPRPVIGIVLYGLSGVLGWFVNPVLGAATVVLMILFHAATSEGVRARR